MILGCTTILGYSDFSYFTYLRRRGIDVNVQFWFFNREPCSYFKDNRLYEPSVLRRNVPLHHSRNARRHFVYSFSQCCRRSYFYAPQLVPPGTAEARISHGISVCLSVCPSVRLSVTTRYGFNARWDRDSGSSPYDSLEYLVSNEVTWCHWVRRFPSNEGIERGAPLSNRYFTTIGASSVKTVADRHKLAAFHNKHCRRAFQWYQHRWPWTTLNPQNRGL